jgi:hypothetical protein
MWLALIALGLGSFATTFAVLYDATARCRTGKSGRTVEAPLRKSVAILQPLEEERAGERRPTTSPSTNIVLLFTRA